MNRVAEALAFNLYSVPEIGDGEILDGMELEM